MKLPCYSLFAGLSIGCLIQTASPLQAQEGKVSTALSSAQPPQEAIISSITDETGGWQWRWSGDTGRRDVAQSFTAPSDFTLDKISLSIRSGSPAAISRSPFTLTLSRYADAQATVAMEKLASWRGELPDNTNGTAFQQGTWLTFDIPDTPLQKGIVYGFTLQFDAVKPTGQGVVFSVAQADGYPAGRGLFSTDGQSWQPSLDFNFLMISAGAGLRPTPPPRAPRVLEVDRGGGAEFKTIAAAIKVIQPGDTISLKANSGPYREILYIPVSGTAQAPITVEGNGNVVTGFEPLTDWNTKNGVTTCSLPSFPCVLSYKGERLVQDAATRQFTKFATINEEKDRITLQPGVSTEGWEISRRAFAVQITNTSYQTFRNIRASGSANDGFNLHGTGQSLVFENIEGFHNLDEGFSSHDDIKSEIRGAKFWGNDNGLANVGQSQTRLAHIDVWENLGHGLWLNDCKGDTKDVRSWGNGAEQIIFRNATVTLDNVQAFTPASSARPWISYQESAPTLLSKPYSERNSQLTGTVTIRTEATPVK
jgi:hypothetical protein